MSDKYSAVRKQVRTYLKSKGLLHTVDTTLINELTFNIEIADQAREDIRERGIQVNIRKDPDAEPYLQVNQSIGIYQAAIKSITAISTKLGITILERTKMGIGDIETGPDILDTL